MEPISGLAALYEILRRKAGARTESTGKSLTQAHQPARAPAQRIQFAELEQQIRTRLQAQPHDSLTSAASKRWVIASLLSWEYDARLQNEPKFNALVRTAQQAIDGDPALKARFERVLEQLSR